MEVLRCVSCHREVSDDFVRFKCPKCGHEIIRCIECRERAVPWVCPNCGFEGP